MIRRGLIKIAFGFAHLVLGAGWTFSREAEPLRDAAWGRGDGEVVAGLVTGLDPGIRDVVLRTEADRDTRHLIALMPMGRLSAVAVSLFGSPLLTMGVHLQVTVDQLEAGIADANRMTVSTLPKGGDVQWVDAVDFTHRMATATTATASGGV